MKIYIETLGCKVNTYESEIIKEEFLRNGYEEAKDVKMADVIVVNTCSVTNQSDAKSRKVIRAVRKANEKAILVVCGCSSQNHQDALKELGADILRINLKYMIMLKIIIMNKLLNIMIWLILILKR